MWKQIARVCFLKKYQQATLVSFTFKIIKLAHFSLLGWDKLQCKLQSGTALFD
jgi:hypothetical protein